MTVAYGGVDYVCDDSWRGFDYYDCVVDGGWTDPSFTFPDLYCSGSSASLECDENWYPAAGYEFITYNWSTYACDESMWTANDFDCGRYFGGDPAMVFDSLKCTLYSDGMSCLEGSYYPSDWEGKEVITVGFDQYLCQRQFLGGWECQKCFVFCNPTTFIFAPDLYCDDWWNCSEDRF